MALGNVVEVTPTVSTTPAYTAADQIGGIQTIRGVNENAGADTCILSSVTILDKGAQKSALDIFIFDELPTVTSSDNVAVAISDAEMEKAVAHIVVLAADYRDIGSTSSVAHLRNLNLLVKPVASGTVYAVVVARGTPTYLSTTDLVFKYGFLY